MQVKMSNTSESFFLLLLRMMFLLLGIHDFMFFMETMKKSSFHEPCDNGNQSPWFWCGITRKKMLAPQWELSVLTASEAWPHSLPGLGESEGMKGSNKDGSHPCSSLLIGQKGCLLCDPAPPSVSGEGWGHLIGNSLGQSVMRSGAIGANQWWEGGGPPWKIAPCTTRNLQFFFSLPSAGIKLIPSYRMCYWNLLKHKGKNI